MPTMANVKLSTNRPITMHPHYEDAGLRDRVMRAYVVYSRKSHDEAFQILKDMHVNYVVFEMAWCRRGGKPGCSMPELWDFNDIANRGKPALCEKFQKGKFGPFQLVFKNDHYGVFFIQPVKTT